MYINKVKIICRIAERVGETKQTEATRGGAIEESEWPRFCIRWEEGTTTIPTGETIEREC